MVLSDSAMLYNHITVAGDLQPPDGDIQEALRERKEMDEQGEGYCRS